MTGNTVMHAAGNKWIWFANDHRGREDVLAV
jgi:hypothetical protein